MFVLVPDCKWEQVPDTLLALAVNMDPLVLAVHKGLLAQVALKPSIVHHSMPIVPSSSLLVIPKQGSAVRYWVLLA